MGDEGANQEKGGNPNNDNNKIFIFPQTFHFFGGGVKLLLSEGVAKKQTPHPLDPPQVNRPCTQRWYLLASPKVTFLAPCCIVS